MSTAKKPLPLHSRETRRRSAPKRADAAVAGREQRIDAILTDAKLDKRSREILADAAVDYAPLMKRLADK